MDGVVATAVGFSGGFVENPTYRMVCGKETGHAEVVLVKFDPTVISYERLLVEFFQMHDAEFEKPGSQYRSAVFTYNEEQSVLAHSMIERLRGEGRRIATEVTPASKFWLAENYHQQYYEKRGLGRPAGKGCILP